MEPGAQNFETKKTVTASVPPVTTEAKTAENTEAATATDEGKTPKWDSETDTYIKNLRKENAKFRTELNGLKAKADKTDKVSRILNDEPDSQEDPKVKMSLLEQKLQGLETRSALLESAIEFGIPKERIGYFGYLVQEKASSLNEGEDLDIEPIANEVLSLGKSAAPATKSVTAPKTTTDTKADSGEISFEQFKKMGFLEKSRLQKEKPELYRTLKAKLLA